MIPVEIRSAAMGDAPMILSYWLNHFKNHSSFARRIKKSVYFEEHQKKILTVFSNVQTKVLIAHAEGEPNVILGFIVTQGKDVLHFVFVKGPFRKFGLASRLLQESELSLEGASFTHWTYDVDALTSRYPSLTYNPYLF